MLPRLLAKIAQGLERRRLPYMLVGGQAVLVHGEPRLTRDVDVTLGVGPERLEDVLAFARAEGWKVLVSAPVEFVRKSMVLPCLDEGSGIRIDLIFSFSEYERQAIARARCMAIEGAQVRFATAEDIVILKIVAGRPRDLEDVRGILLKNPDIDEKYVRHWLGEFDRGLEDGFTKRFDELRK